MNKNEMPTGIGSGYKKVKFSQIYNDFSSTEYGQKLASNSRYERYKPSSLTKEEWEKILGVDVNNLKHLKLSYGLARQFIRYSTDSHGPTNEVSEEQTLTKKEQEDLLLAAIVHDWAEAVVGDISYDLKSKAQEEKEYEELKKMTHGMFKEGDSDLLDRIHFVTDTVIKDTSTKLGKMFNSIERIGYVRTALRAWQASKNSAPELQNGLEWLTNNVFSGQITKLIEYSVAYNPVKVFLKENRDLINDAFNNISNESFLNYKKPEEREEKMKQFKTTQAKWQEFCSRIQ
jgi:hypothetical protein